MPPDTFSVIVPLAPLLDVVFAATVRPVQTLTVTVRDALAVQPLLLVTVTV